MIKSTLGENLHVLPIGIRKDNAIKRDFSLFVFQSKHERKIQEDKQKHRAMNQAGIATKVVISLLDNLCGMDFQSLTLTEKNVLLRELKIPDFLIIWANLRIETLGENWSVKYKCPREGCKEEFVWSTNLLEAEYKMLEDNESLDWIVELKKGFNMRDCKITKVGLEFPNWGTAMDIKSSTDPIQTKHNAIRSSIKYLITDKGERKDFQGIALTQDIFDEIFKVDIELINRSLNDYNYGVDWALNVICPNCGTEFPQMKDWSYDNFFSFCSD